MKNLHLLPTENYSPLVHSTNKYDGYFKSAHYSPMKEMGDFYQHIYITSDEEIKANGEWYYNTITNAIFQMKYLTEYDFEQDKKIILTTDQDLIDDGVQAIDDEFLEWFVKNLSCEEVEVEREYITPLGDIVKTCYDNERLNYKIIIPTEEPKQETLEEVAEKYAEGKSSSSVFQEAHKTDFIEGAKWQQERMYSEEDLREAFKQVRYCKIFEDTQFEDWLEHYKKK